MTPEERAWLAGIIDGEGYIGIRRGNSNPKAKSPSYELLVTVYNTGKPLVDHCLEITGLGSMWCRDKGAPNKLAYEWTVFSKNALEILDEIYPYLILKQEQVNVARQLQDTMQQGRRGLSPEIVEEKENLWLTMKELNHKGVR